MIWYSNSMVWHSNSMLWYCMVRCGMVWQYCGNSMLIGWLGMVWYSNSMVWYGIVIVWHGMAWHSIV